MNRDGILNLICKETGVSLDDLKSKTRKRSILYVRKLAVYYLNGQIPDIQFIAKYLNQSVYSIARYRNSFEKEMHTDKVLRYLKNQCDLALKRVGDDPASA